MVKFRVGDDDRLENKPRPDEKHRKIADYVKRYLVRSKKKKKKAKK